MKRGKFDQWNIEKELISCDINANLVYRLSALQAELQFKLFYNFDLEGSSWETNISYIT